MWFGNGVWQNWEQHDTLASHYAYKCFFNMLESLPDSNINFKPGYRLW